VATLWHYIREGEVQVALPEPRNPISSRNRVSPVRLLDLSGAEVQLKQEAGVLKIPVTVKRYALLCDGVTKDELAKALETAKVASLPSLKVWIQAEKSKRCEGKMALGSAVELKDDGAFGDFVVCTDAPSPKEPQEWFCEYTVDIPRKGTWSVWARLRYPTGTDMSFAFVPAGEPLTLSLSQVLGNSGQNEGKWHWDGQGGGMASVPGQRARQLKLDKGPFTFRIYAREGTGSPQTNPRIDLLCLCDDPGYVPTDEDARAGKVVGAP